MECYPCKGATSAPQQREQFQKPMATNSFILAACQDPEHPVLLGTRHALGLGVMLVRCPWGLVTNGPSHSDGCLSTCLRKGPVGATHPVSSHPGDPQLGSRRVSPTVGPSHSRPISLTDTGLRPKPLTLEPQTSSPMPRTLSLRAKLHPVIY